MREKNLYDKIRNSVQSQAISEPFKATDFNFIKVSSRNFLWKHSNENLKLKGNTYFEKVSRGKYILI